MIDNFLESIPNDAEEEKDAAQKNKRKPTPADAAVDYVAYLKETEDAEQEKDNNSSRTLALIDDFIDDGGFQLPKLDATADAELEYKPAIDDDEVNSNSETTENSGIFTETLARIYIKQGKYERAHEIIERLYHKQPNKSAYYTDQMRFLEKLIINSKNNK